MPPRKAPQMFSQSSSSTTAAAKALTLDSTQLYLTALNSPHPNLSFSPIPSSFPPSKLIPKTRFLIDSFRYPTISFSAAYFLSHFHSDHYSGLSPSWSKGIIFCSHTTSLLLIQILKIPPHFIFPLALNDPVVVDGCEVILIDANHCPGAVQFLFKVPTKNGSFERYVHTGDCRYCNSMKMNSYLNGFVGCDAIFLDTTYCDPKFVFPSQEESVDYVVSVVDRIGKEFEKERVLFLVATYVVGKEKILVEVARRCKRKICVDGRKMEILRVLGYGDNGVFTEDESESDVHVVGWNVLGETWPYFRPNFARMKEIMVEKGYEKVIGFVPTGWTYEVKRNKFAVRSKDTFEIHLVPYSEHSNYDELREYVKFLKPKKVIPTVGMDIEKLDSKHADKLRKHFAGLVDEMANKKDFLMGFHRGNCESVEKIEVDASAGLNEEKDMERKRNVSEMKTDESNDIDTTLNDSSSVHKPDSHDSTMPSEEERERIIEEFWECLPKWVTRDQILDLISSSGWNIVEAVSNFYEREIELYEQVSAFGTSDSTSLARSPNKSVSLLNSGPFRSSKRESVSIRLSEASKSPSLKLSVQSSISPGKRKKNTENKLNKKLKSNSKLESSGSKQPTITSFFSKLLADDSEGGRTCQKNEECPKGESTLPSNLTKSYLEKIDQFIQIINAKESSRNYVATLLEKTQGDINKALDLYYSNPEVNHGENTENLVLSSKSVQVQSCNNDCSVSKNKPVPEESRCMAESSLQRQPVENVDTTLVSLPPDKYKPIEHACWRCGQPAPYVHLARTFDLVGGQKGKIKATSMLCNMFRSLLALSPEDVLPAVYLCTNKIAADHENIELNLGGSLVTSALEEACGTSRSKIRDMYNDMGDLGDVAQACRQTQTLLAPPPPLLIRDVLSVLRKISLQTGSGSTIRKKNLIVNLMRSCREKEMKFLVRTLVRNLRIGAMMKTILPALAQAVVMTSSPNLYHEATVDSLKEKLQDLSAAVIEAYNVLPNLDLVVPSLMKEGVAFSSSILSMVPGIPIKPMLAKITNGVQEVLKLFQNKAFTCEYKYDGQRAQIHKLADGIVRVFSRNGDETTVRFPDLINIIKESCKPAAQTFILDAEVVAIDRKNGHKLMSFQELSSRGRGSKDSLVTVDKIKVDICVFVFDIMFANGEQLLGFPLRQRRKCLKDLFLNEKLGHFEYAKEITVEANDACLTSEATLTRMNSFLEHALQCSCEGIMVKSLDTDAGYLPSKRGDTWLKVKRDYVEGLGDSLDLVPIGAWHGNGRKAGWYSPFLMACYNPDTEDYQSVCRVMSGFSDSFYKEGISLKCSWEHVNS
ncbi:DNA ligase 6 isoform X3 [Durio zibethinus]|uniref:DNA ligase n=1 Tax=Durio zibethinus TaxID=66656 RepID=A0A6P6B484_DURZI|nr:DNA ligase 6 isoform X3 [Durio zibethinus]